MIEEIMSTLYELSRKSNQLCMQSKLDDPVNKDFTIKVHDGSFFLCDLREKHCKGPQAPRQPSQQPPPRQIDEHYLRKRVAPVEHDTSESSKKARRKATSVSRLKALKIVLEERCRRGAWNYEVDINDKLKQQLSIGANEVEESEGEVVDRTRLRILIANYVPELH